MCVCVCIHFLNFTRYCFYFHSHFINLRTYKALFLFSSVSKGCKAGARIIYHISLRKYSSMFINMFIYMHVLVIFLNRTWNNLNRIAWPCQYWKTTGDCGFAEYYASILLVIVNNMCLVNFVCKCFVAGTVPVLHSL